MKRLGAGRSFFIGIILVFIGYVGYIICTHQYDTELHKQTIHLYIDEATNPSFLQMIDFVNVPEEDIKVLVWKRYEHTYPTAQLIQQNTIVANGVYYPENGKVQFKLLISDILHRYPQADWVIHANFAYFGNHAATAITMIPKSQVKQIHLYEDSMGQVLRHEYMRKGEIPATVTALRKMIQSGNPVYYFDYMSTLPQVYPTIFHVSFFNEIQAARHQYEPLFGIPNLQLVAVDLVEIKNELDSEAYHRLMQLLHFNPDEIKEELDGREMGVLLLGILQSPEIENQVNIIKDLIRRNSQADEIVWYGKNHPVRPDFDPNSDFKSLNSRMPFEILFLTDLPLKYVAGIGSSAFYACKPEQILAYIPQNPPYYRDSLIRLGILNPSVIIETKDNSEH